MAGFSDAHWSDKVNYRTRAIIIRGLYTFYPLFEIHLCTVTFGLMYVNIQERFRPGPK